MVSQGVTVAELVAKSRSLNSDSARLDVELLLAEVLAVDRAFLRAWPEHTLTAAELGCFDAMLARRRRGEPMAYILGRREFWSLALAVTPHTLIPRPATETLVGVALQMAPPADQHAALRVLDLGTGSGAVALALASERPDWQVDAIDVDPQCVQVAAGNASRHSLANVQCWCSDWFGAVASHYDLIVANPPYIDGDDRHLQQGDVRFEPRRALVAADAGLAAIRELVTQAGGYLCAAGLLAIEHGYDQAGQVRALFAGSGFAHVETVLDSAGHARVTHGRWAGTASC